MKFKFTTVILAFAFLLSGSFAWSQSQTPLDIALRHIEQNYKTWGLTKEDVADMAISDMYKSNHNGVTHIYFKQRHQGIGLQNAILNVNITEDGKVLFVGKRFFPGLSAAVNSTAASISADQALQKVLNDLNISTKIPHPVEENDGKLFNYDKTGISNFDIKVELTYKNIASEIFLAWNLIIAPEGNKGMWDYSIDATNGQIIEKRDMIIHCKFEKDAFHNHNDHCQSEAIAKKAEPSVKQALAQSNSTATLAGSYRVFALPTESPIHGPQELVVDPAHPTASPFGWHDINGNPAPEYTIPRGNNVYAFEDRDGDGTSNGTDPDGGPSLVFDFPYISDGEAIDNVDAAVTNLFYMNNIMHDFSYVYGFTEAAGNFQRNTYGNGGAANDEVYAYAQASATATIPQTNNASFGAPPDGNNPSMNMYVWTNPGNEVFTVTAPSSVAGGYTSATADFGGDITTVPLTAEVIEVDDGVYNPYLTDGCEDYISPEDFVGKIALIDRGGCEFGAKALRAENAGAIAVIVCNFDPDPIVMGAGAVGAQVTIPAVMIGFNDCQTIRQFAGNGLEVTLQTPTVGAGPDFLDGDFDNGIIAHEFAHGISNRLTGGPANAGCLPFQNNEETMGEGWSDFFSLITTVKPGDTGETGRGIATYVRRHETTGLGLRNFRYSTDMSVNPLTYGDVATNQETHAVGEVWTAMLWDLYWAFVEEYGFDENQWTGTGGNNMAIQLVMDGMKMQPCVPGFVDGRNAILAADQALYGGANQCLIWDVFARRGCGIDADQGDPNSAGDQIESFESLPTCIAELKIKKTVSPLVEAGEDIDVTIKITNHKPETLTGIVVTDALADGTDYISGSNSGNVVEGGVSGGFVSFELGTMEYLDEIIFTYKLSTDESNFSIRHFYDDMEDLEQTFWFPTPITGNNFWTQTTADSYSGSISWFVEDPIVETQQQLQGGTPILVEGDLPVLRFYHNLNTEAGADGGVVQLSTDGGTTWKELTDDLFRNPYDPIQYGTFVIPNYHAFSGNSEGWIGSYADLSAYAGQQVHLRFHFRTDDNTAPAAPAGWWVDDVEIMDMINYTGEACVTSDQGDEACVSPDSRGTIIESQVTTSIKDPVKTVFLNVFPNPTEDVINFSISSLGNEEVTISILTLDGRVVGGKAVSTSTSTQTFSMDVSHLPAGFYFVKASTNHDVTIEKIVIH